MGRESKDDGAARTRYPWDGARRAMLDQLSNAYDDAMPGDVDPERWRHPARPDARYARVLEQVKAMLVEIDDDGRVVDVSDTCEAVTGFTREEYIGSRPLLAVHDDDLPEVGKLGYKSNLRGNGPPVLVVFRSRKKNGHWVWHETSSVQMFRAEDGTVHTVAYVEDVTERMLAEATLRESNDRHRAVLEIGNDAISEVDENGAFMYTSPNSFEFTGYSSEDLASMDAYELIHPDDIERVRRFVIREAGEVISIEPYRLKARNGEWLWVESRGVTYQRDDGSLRFLAISRDVTADLKAREDRHVLEEQIQQTQKLESLGVMAGGIAHDFNNLLTPILGAASLAMMDLPKNAPERARFAKIQNAAQRAAVLTHQMLSYAGVEALEMEPVGVSQLVEEVSRLLESAVSGKTVLAYELRSRLDIIHADASQLSQVLLNLVTNAAEAVGDGEGRITVRTGAEQGCAEPRATNRTGDLAPGPHVFIEVEDTGCGIDDATASRIFEPFFTTKFTGRGLGLAAALGIVRGHGGTIEIDSKPGRGSRFRVLLPVEPVPGAQPQADRAAIR